MTAALIALSVSTLAFAALAFWLLADREKAVDLVIAKCDASYWQHVAGLRSVTVREQILAADDHMWRLTELERDGRVLPDVRDERDLIFPTWPIVRTPIFDSLPDAREVDALVLAAVAERVAS